MARRAWIPALLGVTLAALWPMSCTSVDNLVAPSCTFDMSPASASFGGNGGNGTFNVTAGDVCTWTAQSSASWITITSGASGKGSGKVGYAVLANSVTNSRSASVTVSTDGTNGSGFAISQAGGNCTFSVSPTFASFPSNGGGGEVTVGAPAGCSWTSSPGASWITITAGSGSGNGVADFTVAPNTDSTTREGALTVAGQTVGVAVAPPAPSCSYAASPQTVSVDDSATTGSIAVAASNNCAWSATSTVSWLTITAGSVGTGNGTVRYSIAANTTNAPRTGLISLADLTITVNQSAPCAFTVKPTSASFSAIGGSGSITVTTTAGCAWTASEGAAWITIASGAQATGSGTVTYTVSANGSGKDRTAPITVAGVDVAITETGTLKVDESSASSYWPQDRRSWSRPEALLTVSERSEPAPETVSRLYGSPTRSPGQ